MENYLHNSSSLELTIAMPGFSSSPSLPSSGESGGNTLMKEVDINKVPSSGIAVGDDECMEGEEEEDQEDESPNGGPAPRKKLRLSREQSRLLEQTFTLNHTLNPKQKQTLAEKLELKPRQVEVWFQNRRARSKLKQTEMECEYLKRWFGSLTEQNRKLHKELEELRALKVGPNHHLPSPSTSLTMCPRCQCVATTNHHNTTAGAATSTTNTKNRFLHPPQQPSAACYN